MSELFKVNSLTKEYCSGQETVHALKEVTISLDSGDYLAIIGHSGAGKTTLLHTLGGLDHPTKGQVLFKGRNIYKMRDKELSIWRNKHIGFVFQFYHLIDELNVLENITLALDLNRRKYSLKTIEDLLEYLGIENKKKAFPSQLSGGQKQRVAFARALVNDPEVILCDEPTGNLDKESQERVVSLLDKLNKEKNKTIILVTHNSELAKCAKDRIFIKDGEIE
ncbi:MAG: ABC transporter ATP-binding protein [Candidatus Omnitrophica bacterium]|nr:ABC transporter ATP-binding protein [Candidatus Omnitrophota bacterium]